jgi:hypothetical protein
MEKQTTEKHGKMEQHKSVGATNLEYNLFSEVHCLLKGNAALVKYMEDAREAGERDIESCFKTILDQNKENVVKLRDLIGKHISKPS